MQTIELYDALLAGERAADPGAVRGDGRRDRLLPLKELELQAPLLLLLQAPSLALHLPADLALLRRDILSLALYRPRQAARLGGRHRREDHHEDRRNSQSHGFIVAPKGSASSKPR